MRYSCIFLISVASLTRDAISLPLQTNGVEMNKPAHLQDRSLPPSPSIDQRDSTVRRLAIRDEQFLSGLNTSSYNVTDLDARPQIPFGAFNIDGFAISINAFNDLLVRMPPEVVIDVARDLRTSYIDPELAKHTFTARKLDDWPGRLLNVRNEVVDSNKTPRRLITYELFLCPIVPPKAPWYKPNPPLQRYPFRLAEVEAFGRAFELWAHGNDEPLDLFFFSIFDLSSKNLIARGSAQLKWPPTEADDTSDASSPVVEMVN